ncbi:hypothetical protein WR25_15147 [Diploscapter pachys]|uniref:C3H1-type domain-containing protein n=1 Tax=Diploscapter pachys TaxID=2018661 RepID=A0A2A2K4C3_9BILA|nr:hypothetical protein WR25_15147 [Diploscapter pachys]
MSLNLLLNAYDDDSDEEEEEKEHSDSDENQQNSEGNGASTSDLNSAPAPLKSAFFNDGSSSEDSDAEERQNSEATTSAGTTSAGISKTEKVLELKDLPSADALFGQSNVKHSVFTSLEQKEQMLHEAKLSQHVQMSDKAREENEERAKKRKSAPCRQFQRGRCFRGSSCKFAHITNDNKTPVETKGSVMEVKPEFYKDPNDVFKFAKAKKPRLS